MPSNRVAVLYALVLVLPVLVHNKTRALSKQRPGFMQGSVEQLAQPPGTENEMKNAKIHFSHSGSTLSFDQIQAKRQTVSKLVSQCE